MKVLLIALLLIIFMPLPLKTSIYFSKENYYIKLFNFKIISKKKKTKNIPSDESNNSEKSTPAKKKKRKKKKIKNLPIKDMLLALCRNRFKPSFRAKGYISYSLNDAAKTAITYGSIIAIMPLLYKSILLFFKIKKFNINITPIFKDEFFIEIKLNSIIFISIGQIIYMLFLIIKIIIREKVRKYE